MQHYMPENLNLETMMRLTVQSLNSYAEYLAPKKRFKPQEGVRFRLESGFSLVPKLNYSASAQFSVIYNDTNYADLYVKVFLPYDGTGKSSETSKINMNDVPNSRDYKFLDREDRILPSSKNEIVEELYFPIFSTDLDDIHLDETGQYLERIQRPFLTSLDLLTLNERTRKIEVKHSLGSTKKDLHTAKKARPIIQRACGEVNGERFSDPHAVFNNTNLLQVGGFLRICHPHNPLIERLAEYVTMPLEFEKIDFKH